MKQLFKIFLLIIVLSSCTHPIAEIPIEDIHAHRLFINSHDYSDNELFSIYEDMYLENENYKNEPYIYYFLSRFESKRFYLDEGLNKFPNDPFINFNKKKYINQYEENELNSIILSMHPRFNLSMVNYLNQNKDLIEIFLGSTTRQLIENDIESNTSWNEFSENFSELEYGYKNGDPVTSEYHNFKDSNYGLVEAQVEFLDESFQNIKSIVKRVNDSRENCSDKEASLRAKEKNRIGRMSYTRFVEEPEVNYMGDCKYQISMNIIDELYYNQYQNIITYYYNDGSWDWVSADSWKAINGRWVKQ